MNYPDTNNNVPMYVVYTFATILLLVLLIFYFSISNGFGMDTCEDGHLEVNGYSNGSPTYLCIKK
jgi:hypothetical protein